MNHFSFRFTPSLTCLEQREAPASLALDHVLLHANDSVSDSIKIQYDTDGTTTGQHTGVGAAAEGSVSSPVYIPTEDVIHPSVSSNAITPLTAGISRKFRDQDFIKHR